MASRGRGQRTGETWDLDDEDLELLEQREARRRELAGELEGDSEDELERAPAARLDSDAEESDEEGGAQTRKRKSTRDGELIAHARLRQQQGIEGEHDEEDEGAFVLGGLEEGAEEAAAAGAAQQKERKPRAQHSLEHVFGRAADAGPMESFSMRDYRETEGGYLRDRGEREAITDAWLESVQPAEQQEKARAAEEGKSGMEDDDEDGGQAAPSQMELLGRLIGILQGDEETVPGALRRLGAAANATGAAAAAGGAAGGKPAPFKKNVRKKNLPASPAVATAAADGGSGQSEMDGRQAAHRKQQFDSLTDLSATLMKLGVTSVYTMSRAQLARSYQAMQETRRREAEAARLREEARRAPLWEYRWSPQDPEVHGPFPGDKMNQWREHFDTAVVRRVLPPGEDGRARLQVWRPASGVPDFRVVPADDPDASGSAAAVASPPAGSPRLAGSKRSAAAVSEPPTPGSEDAEDIFAFDEPRNKKLRQR